MRAMRTGMKTKALLLLSALLLLGGLSVGLIDRHVRAAAAPYLFRAEEVPPAEAILVLGARVYPDGRVSDIVKDRLDTGVELYRLGRAPKILVSGDHGRKDYDEVNTMKNYLLKAGVPEADIFMDHAGFDTYDSMYRARDVFLVRKAIVVTQDYHVKRAVYLGRELGIDTYGVASDHRNYRKIVQYEAREVLARSKDFWGVHVLHAKPKCLGEAIPITADGRATNDK
ncbi:MULTISPECIES: SanA/YdcF family protein [Paenibacillus]|uniref:SanA/YdcF family protein n=1 Tax=Paenibacillus TaxID=44249 RepID=UPI0022B8CCAF|nr:ElyC/SanA/YdcF family protein [Paenibacillus caseinilyticus]MCZ8521750.1 YdcF family protein [Paenibacillus caseinilyticus]